MSESCIIKERKFKGHVVSFTERRIAQLTGQPVPKNTKRIRYERQDTGDLYLALSGGLAWPGLYPGFAVVLGVAEGTDGPTFHALEETESGSSEILIGQAISLFDKWGAACNETRFLWYGDYESGMTDFLTRINRQRPQGTKPFILTPPPHLEDEDAFHLYVQQILSLSHRQAKRLFIGPCERLRIYLSNLEPTKAAKDKLRQHPAIGALGAVLTAFLRTEPWREERNAVAEPVNYETEARYEQAQTMRNLVMAGQPEGPDYGQLIYPDGWAGPTEEESYPMDPIPTVS